MYKRNTEGDCYSLFVSDGLVAAVTNTHLKFKAHQGDGGTFGWTFSTHRLPTLPTVVLLDRVSHVHSQKDDPLLLTRTISVENSLGLGRASYVEVHFMGRLKTCTVKYLSQSNLLAVPHLLEIPEEGLLTLLAGVTVQPFWSLKN